MKIFAFTEYRSKNMRVFELCYFAECRDQNSKKCLNNKEKSTKRFTHEKAKKFGWNNEIQACNYFGPSKSDFLISQIDLQNLSCESITSYLKKSSIIAQLHPFIDTRIIGRQDTGHNNSKLEIQI